MEDIIEKLRAHAHQHDLKERALQSCREYLENYRVALPEEFARELEDVS